MYRKKLGKQIIFFVAVFAVFTEMVFLLAIKNDSIAQTSETDSTIPATPMGLMLDGNPTSTSISLKWTDNSTNEDKFNLERKATSATDWAGAWSMQIITANMVSYTDTSVTSGTIYDYRVQACRSGYGCSDYAYLTAVSPASGSDTIPPSSPTTLVATKDDYNEVDLSWTASTDNVGVTGYEVWRNSAGNWTMIGQIPNPPYLDITVSPANSYYYKIIAYDTAGNKSSPSSNLFLNTPASNNVLLPPSSVTASSTTGKIDVSWPTSTSAVKYSIYRKVNGGSYQVWYTNITNLYYHDPNIISGNIYQYKVFGCDNATCSATGTESNSVTYSGGEVSCTGLNLTLNDGKTSYTIGENVNYTWTCSPGGSASNVSIWLYKPDGTSVNYNSGSGSTQSMVFGTSNLIPGLHTLKACFDPACAVVNASREFTVVSSTKTDPTFTLSPTVNEIIGYTSKKLLKATAASTPAGYDLTSAMGKITDYSGNTMSGSPFSLTYQTNGYWSYEYEVSALASGNYYFCAKGFYNSTEIPWTCGSASFNITGSAVETSYSNVSIYPDALNSTGTFKTLQVTVTPAGTNLYNVKGKIRKDGAYGVSAFESIILAFDQYSNSWRKEFDTNNLTSGGSYVFCANAYLDSTLTHAMPEVCTGVFTVDDGTTAQTGEIPQLEVYFQNTVSSALKGDVNIAIKTSIEPDSVNFKVRRDIGSEAYPAAVKIDAYNYYFLWKTTEYYDGNYTVYATAKKGTYEKTASVSAVVSNYTAVTTDSTNSLAITFTDNFQPPLSGDKTIGISGNKNLDSCKFKVEGLKFAEFAGSISSMKCSFLLHSANFPDGSYSIRAIASSGTNTKEQILYTSFLNQSTDQTTSTDIYIPQECKDKGYATAETCQNYMMFAPECRAANILDFTACQSYMYKYGMPPECQDQGVQTPEGCQKIIFMSSMPQECKDAGTTTMEECDKIMSAEYMLTPECKTANISTADACNTYMIEKFTPAECQNTSSQEECGYTLRNSYNNALPLFQPNSTFDTFQPMTENFPTECRDANITSGNECKTYMMKLSMPAECREANVTSSDECEKVMFKKFGPKECIDAQIFDPDGCEKFMFKKYAPEDCKQAGIFNPEACKKYMYEKYNDAENLPIDKFPIECQKAKATTPEACEKLMKTTYMPKDCKDKGIEDETKCDEYLQKKYMPKECQDAGASTSGECDKVMFKKYAPKQCLKAGIEDEGECQKYMFNLYAPKVKCDNVEDWQCKKSLEEKHLGDVVAKQSQFSQIKENSAGMIGKAIKVKELQGMKGFENGGMIPLSDTDASLRMVSATENMVLNEEDALVQTGPVAFMVDSDDDGLSDDIEKLLGTDSEKSDSDGDGYKDGEEVRTGHDPLGEGLFKGTLLPVEKAMINNSTLEHPKTSGEESDNLTVSEIENLSDINKTDETGYLLSGRSEAGSVVTLYIYSDMPLVLTVKANDEGNWEYELDKPLSDGEHEVYVVVNDDTGKVVSKSKPSSLFVKEAKAVTANEFIDESTSALAEKTPEEISVMKYNSVMFLSILAGLSIFGIILILRKRKKRVEK